MTLAKIRSEANKHDETTSLPPDDAGPGNSTDPEEKAPTKGDTRPPIQPRGDEPTNG